MKRLLTNAAILHALLGLPHSPMYSSALNSLQYLHLLAIHFFKKGNLQVYYYRIFINLTKK